MAGLTAEERVAIGFAVDPVGAAGIKGGVKTAAGIRNAADNALFAEEQAVPGDGFGGRTGVRTQIPPASDVVTAQALVRENESAEILANKGYKVEQNPDVAGSKNPDYRINGEIFDNYAPSTSNVRNAASEIGRKVFKGQADNVVINLSDSSISPFAFREQLLAYPIPGLRQVILIDKSGKILVIKFTKN